jgi:predicted nucleotidyltransferase
MSTDILRRISKRFDASHGFAFADSCVMLCYVGSQSHGTTIPSTEPDGYDDVDLMAVVLPPAPYLVGLDEFDVWVSQWEELDVCVYSFHKFVRLLIKSNPNVLGTLWLRDEDYLIRRTPWRQLEESRHLFATRAAHGSFAGYANGQLQRMTSYSPAIHAELQALEAYLADVVGWSLQDVMDKRSVGMPRNGETPEAANAAADRVRYLRAKYHAAYMGEKRKRLVIEHGYDTKNAAHLVRLLRMCVEFLETGRMNVYRTHDAEELKEIKRGEWTLDEVQAVATDLFAQAKSARDWSTLPHSPDVPAISALVTSIACDSLRPPALSFL